MQLQVSDNPTIEELEQALVRQVAKTTTSIRAIARAIGISRGALDRRLHRWGWSKALVEPAAAATTQATPPPSAPPVAATPATAPAAATPASHDLLEPDVRARMEVVKAQREQPRKTMPPARPSRQAAEPPAVASPPPGGMPPHRPAPDDGSAVSKRTTMRRSAPDPGAATSARQNA